MSVGKLVDYLYFDKIYRTEYRKRGAMISHMTNKVQIGLRVTPEVAEKLKKHAEKEHRAVNNLIEVIIDEWLKQKETQEI